MAATLVALAKAETVIVDRVVNYPRRDVGEDTKSVWRTR